jgi:uncharacterized LabA/DUF88 family protein
VERVCVFIDGANFYHQCKDNLGRTDVDLGAFAGLLVGPSRTLVRTYYYTCRLTPDHPLEMRKSQEKFLGALDHIDYLEVRLGKLVRRSGKCNACGNVEEKWLEKGVDMRLGVDMLAAAAKDMYDTAVLVSGDGDLAEAVKAVKELGRHAEVAAFPKNRAQDLVKASDVSRDMTVGELKPLLLRGGGSGNGS